MLAKWLQWFLLGEEMTAHEEENASSACLGMGGRFACFAESLNMLWVMLRIFVSKSKGNAHDICLI